MSLYVHMKTTCLYKHLILRITTYRDHTLLSFVTISLIVLTVNCTIKDHTGVITPSSPDIDPQNTISVVTTTTILADWVRQIGGGSVSVHPLVGSNIDAHTFKPTPKDVARMVEADIIFLVGQNYETNWLDKLLSRVALDKHRIIYLSDSVDLIGFKSLPGDSQSEQHLDPHFWHDPIMVIRVIRNISQSLIDVNGHDRTIVDANTQIYLAELHKLDQWINDEIQNIPEQNRMFITNHQTMGYFADRYGFQVLGRIIEGLSSEGSIRPKDVMNIIDKVEVTGAQVIFGEPQMTDRIAINISKDTDVNIVQLYSESLGDPDNETGTYIGMMKANVRTIVESLK